MCLFLSSPSFAATATFNFSGVMDTVGSNLQSSFSSGDNFFGTYTVDLDATGSSLFGNYVRYSNLLNFSFSIGTYSVSIDNLGFTEVGDNNGPAMNFDSYYAAVQYMPNSFGPPIEGFYLGDFELGLFDDFGGAFSSTNLFPAFPPLSSFTAAVFRGSFWGPGGRLNGGTFGGGFSGTLTKIEPIAPVPLPATSLILLGAMGILSLVAHRRR